MSNIQMDEAAMQPAKKAGKKRKTGKKQSILEIVIMSVLALACLTFAFLHKGDLTFQFIYPITSASEVTFGQNGQTLVIDNGKKTLLVLNQAGALVSRYDGGSDKGPFYYACYAVQAEDGSIYVADIQYGERGNLLDRERIIRLNGSKSEVLYEIDYTDWPEDDTPLQYGQIIELQVYEGTVFFLLDTGDAIELKQLQADGSVQDAASIAVAGAKNGASYDAATENMVVIGRNGEMTVFNLADGTETTVYLPENLLPYDVCARSGEVYYTELMEGSVRHFSIAEPAEEAVFCTMDSIPFKLDVSADGGNVLTTDQSGFYRLKGEPGISAYAEYVSDALVSYYIRIVLVWISLVIGAFFAVDLLVKLIIAVASKVHSENATRILLIIVASLAVAFVLAYTLLSQLMSSDTTSSEKLLSVFSDILLSEIDRDALLTLDSPSDYGTETFQKLKEPLDAYTWRSYESTEYYYYILYRAIDGNVVMVMDFEDTMPCARPMYPYDPEDNDYSAVLHDGREIQISEISAYGAWSFVIAPVYGEDGSIIGALEVGQSLDMVQQRQAELRRELIIATVISTIVVAMLMLELTFLITHFQQKRSGEPLDTTQRVPLRTIMFLIYLADSMQDAFIAILCSQLYQGGLPFAEGVAIALPMSAQLLMMAVFSLFAGRIVEKFGSRITMTAGMLVNMSGFLTCMLLGSYSGLLIGKMLIGAGMGTVYVSCNSVAATGKTSALITEANAAVSAGTLAGLTIGAGLASVLLSMGGWKLIYLIGAVIAALGVLLAAFAGDVRLGHSKQNVNKAQLMNVRKYFGSRRVIGFFLLILVPFMMALSYREYFFPLFAQEHGLTELRIGQIYLACGMLTLYIGPSLSAWMIRRLGAYWSILTASAAMGLNMLLFILFPSMAAVILGVVFLSLIISFAYTCQYTYYELTPEISLIGEGRAMGIYSVFESIGQTVGPISYGLLLSFGYRRGISVFCIGMLALLSVFAILTRRLKNIYRE